MKDHFAGITNWEELAVRANFHPVKFASLCLVCPRELQRYFKKHLGTTPSQWLRRLQCRMAKELILQGEPNKVVASKLKFANDPHLCREFKKVFGTSPQSFAPPHVPSLKPDPIPPNVANG